MDSQKDDDVLKAALAAAEDATGEVSYGLSKNGQRIAIAIEKVGGRFVTFMFSPVHLNNVIGKLIEVAGKARALTPGRQDDGKRLEVIKAEDIGISLGDDGRKLALVIEGKVVRFAVPISPALAKRLRDSLDKAIRAVAAEKSGTKGTA